MPGDAIRRAEFVHEGQRLAYSEFGEGERSFVLLHGLLLSREMHEPLALALAARGNRIVTLDLLGHGESDRPQDMWRYSMTQYADQVIALLDHLGLERSIVGGTSLGANVTLEVASRAPERLRAMVMEMPVLDNALLAAAGAFTPLAFALTFGQPVMRLLSAAARAIPRAPLPLVANVILDAVRQDPGPSAAVIQGLLFGRVAPHRSERRTFGAPALVIGHPRDPVHPFSDAGMLAGELPAARLLQASSILELRVAPQRLTDEIADFVDGAWSAPRRGARPRRAAHRPARGRPHAAAGA